MEPTVSLILPESKEAIHVQLGPKCTMGELHELAAELFGEPVHLVSLHIKKYDENGDQMVQIKLDPASLVRSTVTNETEIYLRKINNNKHSDPPGPHVKAVQTKKV